MSSTPTTTSIASSRTVQRERERRARQRRAAKLERLRLTNDALECAVVVARTLGDDAQVWSDFLDAKATRLRYFLLQSLQLTSEATTLRIEQAQLHRLLDEHRIWRQTILGLVNDRLTEDWDALGECWRQLCREHYRPWSREQCHDEIEAAMKQIRAFQWSTDKQTSGLTIDGWREVRRIDPVRSVLQFEFYKTFYGYDVMDYVNVSWDAFTDAPSFREIIGGHRVLLHHEVLQQIGPNLLIVRITERHLGIPGDVHGIYMVYRSTTEQGFMQFVRSIWCPEVVKAVQGPNDMVTLSNFFWYFWDLQENGTRGFTFRQGGILGGIDVSYANGWMAEIFAATVRAEHKATGRTLLVSAE